MPPIDAPSVEPVVQLDASPAGAPTPVGHDVRRTQAGGPSVSDRSMALAAALILSVFLFYVFFHYQDTLPPLQYNIVTLFATFLSGIVGYFLTGSIITDLEWKIPGGPTIKISAVGGFAFALVGLFVFLHLGKIEAVPQSASTLTTQLNNKSETQLIAPSTSPADKPASAPGAKISPKTKDLALQIASADPKYDYLSTLAANHVSAKQLGDIIGKLQGASSNGTGARLEADFPHGVGAFTFGSSTDEVASQLSGIVPRFSLKGLPVAGEYSPADVHYIWFPLRSLRQTPLGEDLLKRLPDASACLSGQSYIVFLFNADHESTSGHLIRIVSRLMPDCGERQQMMKAFADKYQILFNANSAVLFQQVLASTTVGGYVSNDGIYSLDVSQNGSSEPAR